MDEPLCHRDKPPQNGSKAVSLLLRLCTLVLAFTSALVMAATIADDLRSQHGAFVYLVGSNITAAAAIYLKLGLGSGGDDDEEAEEKLPGIMLVVVDVLVVAPLLCLSIGAAYAAPSSTRFGVQVEWSKFLSLAASAAVVLAALAKAVPLQADA